MGQVDFNFIPAVPVFDANVAWGRHRTRTVSVDTIEGILEAMDKACVGRALVYSTITMQASPSSFGTADTWDGNHILMDAIGEIPNLVPQFALNPAVDKLEAFSDDVSNNGIRSVRITPNLHHYPFRDWAVKPWMEWLSFERIGVWVPVDQIDPSELHDTAELYPDVPFVLCESHYHYDPWVQLLMKSLPNTHLEISRTVTPDGITDLIEMVGADRILYGSRFPDSPMPPQLYNLHRCGLSETTLSSICYQNLERILAGESI